MDNGVPPAGHNSLLIDEFKRENAVGVAFGVPLGRCQGDLYALCSLVIDTDVEVLSCRCELRSVGTKVKTENGVIFLSERKQFLPAGGVPKGYFSLPTSLPMYESAVTNTFECETAWGRQRKDVQGMPSGLVIVPTIFSSCRE